MGIDIPEDRLSNAPKLGSSSEIESGQHQDGTRIHGWCGTNNSARRRAAPPGRHWLSHHHGVALPVSNDAPLHAELEKMLKNQRAKSPIL
jgi:hypothetical protein